MTYLTPPLDAIAAPPEWLLDAVLKPKQPQTAPPPSTAAGAPTAYGQAALARQTAEVAHAPEGQRNDTLNRAAFALGQLAAHIPPTIAHDELAQAAHAAGLPTHEAERTITSGMAAGQADPYTPTPAFTAGPIPQPTVISPARLDTDELAPTEGLQLVTLGDLLADPPPAPPEYVEGLIRRGELAVIAAPRAIGKSWLIQQLALLLAAGQGHLFGLIPIVNQARVLLCHGEVDDVEAVRRYRLLAGSPHCPDGPIEGLLNTFDQWRISSTQKRISRAQPDGTSIATTHTEALLDGRLEHDIVTRDIDVLIIDPWAVYYQGSENSNDEMEAALAELRRLNLKYGLTVIVVHHFGKSTEGRDPEDLWRGASRLADWASTRISVTAHYTQTQARELGMTRADGRRYVDVTFLRRSTPIDDLTAERDLDGWFIPWTPPDDDPAGSPTDEGGRPADIQIRWTPDEIAALLAADGEWPSLRYASEAMGISKDSAARVLREAVNRAVIVTFAGPNRAIGYRLPDASLDSVSECPKTPSDTRTPVSDAQVSDVSENPFRTPETAGQPPETECPKTPVSENLPDTGPRRSDLHKRDSDKCPKTPLPPYRGEQGGNPRLGGGEPPPARPADRRGTAPLDPELDEPEEP